jgi:thiol-disulfide isomerase/thioredoxin
VLTGLIVLAAVLVAASGFGAWRRRTDGTVRISATVATGVRKQEADLAEPDATVVTADRLGAGHTLGSRATLLQFSSAFCQPCRATRVILADVASKVDGVEHIEVDAESHLDLVREIGILRTPTTLVLDGAGRVTARASGVPRREQVLAALDVSVR